MKVIKNKAVAGVVISAAVWSLTGVSAFAQKPDTNPIKLDSGVEVTITTAGKDGAKMPKATDSVKVHYRGTFEDGREFDSSYKRGQPISFGLSQVIACWTQGAYGPRGVPGAIPPNATLFFDIELIDING
ncbi:MAG: FKBP-type peptidyl-prolyl cis-trans isomerase [Burkholderiales bacterium]|nr:FKBP-type peptidyl-prolyl cis-trans isomerase [Burkholderiales bacterium]